MGVPLRRALAPVAVAALVTMVGTSCSSSGSATPTTASTPHYERAGPDAVGVTTLTLGSAGPTLGERLATVYYPADRTNLGSSARFSYTESSTVPPAYQGLLPPAYNTTTTLAAFADPPASTAGPFPVVLFSHGYGGQRLYYSNLLVGIASWGYVVVSADYLERGLAAQILGLTATPSAAMDQSIMFASLNAVEQASSSAGSVLHGVADSSRIGAVGHSAGGGTAFNALADRRVATAVGWAPVGPTGSPSTKPVMLIGAEGDTAVLPSHVTATYQKFPGSKSLVEISGEGHNTYTDICPAIRQGGGLIGFAVSHRYITPQLAQLAINGCQTRNLPAERFWPVVQYYTVFQLRSALNGGPKTVPVPGPAAFPGMTVTVTQQH